MKIKVLHENGREETIILAGRLIVERTKEFNVLHSDEMDHVFTKDGHYDGWGIPLPGGVTEEEAALIVDAATRERRMEN